MRKGKFWLTVTEPSVSSVDGALWHVVEKAAPVVMAEGDRFPQQPTFLNQDPPFFVSNRSQRPSQQP